MPKQAYSARRIYPRRRCRIAFTRRIAAVAFASTPARRTIGIALAPTFIAQHTPAGQQRPSTPAPPADCITVRMPAATNRPNRQTPPANRHRRRYQSTPLHTRTHYIVRHRSPQSIDIFTIASIVHHRHIVAVARRRRRQTSSHRRRRNIVKHCIAIDISPIDIVIDIANIAIHHLTLTIVTFITPPSSSPASATSSFIHSTPPALTIRRIAIHCRRDADNRQPPPDACAQTTTHRQHRPVTFQPSTLTADAANQTHCNLLQQTPFAHHRPANAD